MHEFSLDAPQTNRDGINNNFYGSVQQHGYNQKQNAVSAHNQFVNANMHDRYSPDQHQSMHLSEMRSNQPQQAISRNNANIPIKDDEPLEHYEATMRENQPARQPIYKTNLDESDRYDRPDNASSAQDIPSGEPLSKPNISNSRVRQGTEDQSEYEIPKRNIRNIEQHFPQERSNIKKELPKKKNLRFVKKDDLQEDDLL